jgi:hypothetical protein
MRPVTTEKLSPIEKKLLEATRNDALGWETVDIDAIGPECMSGYDRFGWQNYLPGEVRKLWGELPISARLVAYMIARERDYFTDWPVD